MTHVAWLDGKYLPHARARVAADDRAYVFADGIYEVVAIWNGLFIDALPHMARLERSLAGLSIPYPLSPRVLSAVASELVRRNRIRFGTLYLQITRGSAKREHAFPRPTPPCGVFMTTRPGTAPDLAPTATDRIILTPDERWHLCMYKTVALLPNCLAQEAAVAAGCDTAWLVGEDGMVREGAHSNAWIVSPAGVLTTHPLSPRILGGITRARVLELARALQIPIEERAFSPTELGAAAEAFNTDSSGFVRPVVAADGRAIGTGEAGPLSTRLRRAYMERFESGESGARGECLTRGLVAD